MPRFEVFHRDLSPLRRGNTGVDYVHRFDSGRPGPNVLVNALTHGNGFCGMVAALHLLESGVRPRIGTLTVSFANIAAYESFDPDRPFESRQLVHNLNRVWSVAELEGTAVRPELLRVRELRPVVAAADHILDLHSTCTRPARTSNRFGCTRHSGETRRRRSPLVFRRCIWSCPRAWYFNLEVEERNESDGFVCRARRKPQP